MKRDILVSIIIPAYNIELYIEATIDSALRQTHFNIELIVVDDGSTDNTANIVQAICNQDTRARLIKQKNTGVSAARNTGFSASKGKYIAFLDGDDILHPDNIKLLLQKITTDETLGLVHSDYQIIDNNSRKINEYHHGLEGNVLDQLLLEGGGRINCISGSLIKREVIENIGGFDSEFSNGEDHEFGYRIANKYKIGRVPEITWYYRIHSGNAHSNIDSLEKDAIATLIKAELHGWFKSAAFRKKCYANRYFMLAGSLWPIKNNKIKAIKYLLNSIILYPPMALKILHKTFKS